MVLQERDLKILHFINKFGYVNSVHIQKMFEMTQPRTSQILSRLVKADYLKKEQILAKEPCIYLLRTKATELIKANRVKKVSLQNLKHNLCVVDVYIDLKLQKPELNIKSDRELRAGIKFTKKKRPHQPDLVIQTEEINGKKNIAVEIELSRKSKDRLKSISSHYSIWSDYLKADYYCSSSVYSHIRKYLGSNNNIRIFNYFADEEKQSKPSIAKDFTAISNVNSNKVKRLERELKESEREKEKVQKELKDFKEKVERFKKMFNHINFKKATFGNSYSLNFEDLERLKEFCNLNN